MKKALSLGEGLVSWQPWEQPGLAREALEALPVAVALGVRCDDESEPRLVQGNRAFERLTGRRLAPSAPCRLAELAGAGRRPQQEQRLREHFGAGRAVSETLVLRRSGAAAEEMDCRWTPLGASAGSGHAWSLTLTPSHATRREATERAVEARHRAEAAEERLIEAIESISGGFALFDADDRLVLCNETYRTRAYGDGRHVVNGAGFEEVARANACNGCVQGIDSPAEQEAWVRRRVATHRAAAGSFEIDWHDGRTFLMIDRRTRDGGIATVLTDITELKLARENAEQANRAKTRFLAAASHDLRQPLHAMELFVAALEASTSDEQVHAVVGDLREACGAAGRLLSALLDVSEVESGKLEGRSMDFPVQQLLDRMFRVYGPQAHERGLDLRLVRSSHVVHSDPHLLERILGNLLSNAVSYTPRGRILVGCRRRRGRLRIEVWDTGLGVPEQERQRIFEEFHQLDNTARERHRGIGLGLAIVRRLANILGHEIFLHSVRGQGSVFAIELALTGKTVALPRRRHGGAASPVPGRTTVLVIDDDPQIRKAMARALESWGCAVTTAADCDVAESIVLAAPDSVDLIIADYRLPHACNGVQAAGRLRVLCRRMVPVLIVTADQGQDELREIAGQGFPALQKPVDPEALQAAIADLVEGFAVPAPDEATA